MAKKPGAEPTARTPGRKAAETKNSLAPSEVGSSRCDDRTAQRAVPAKPQKPSVLLDTRVVYCGDNLEQLAKLPDACVDLIYPAIAGRPRCVQLARVLKKTGSFYYHCDWHASHHVKVMPIFGENDFQNSIRRN